MKNIIITKCYECEKEFEYDGLSCDCKGECTCDHFPNELPFCSDLCRDMFYFTSDYCDDFESEPMEPF